MGGMRRAVPAPLLGLLLGLAACGPRYDGWNVAEWTAALEDEQRGAAAMDTLQSEEAVEVLSEILKGQSEVARLKAAQVLLRLGPRGSAAVPALTDALKAEDPGLRGMAALALGRIGEGARGSLVALDRALHDRDARVRIAAALAVYGISGDEETTHEELYRALTSRSPGVRQMVTEGLGQLGERGVDLLVVALCDREPGVRLAAATTLGRMGPAAAGATQGLEEALDDEDPEVRAAVLEALKQIRR